MGTGKHLLDYICASPGLASGAKFGVCEDDLDTDHKAVWAELTWSGQRRPKRAAKPYRVCSTQLGSCIMCAVCIQYGRTALDLARENNKPETAKLLEEAAKVTAACAALCRLCQHTPCHSTDRTQRQETFE
eukprot:g1987.t1